MAPPPRTPARSRAPTARRPRRAAVAVALALVASSHAAAERAVTVPAAGRAEAPPACLPAAPMAAPSLRASVEALADPALDGRAAGSPGDAAARAWITARLACAGLAPGGDAGGFAQAWTARDDAGEVTSANVIAVWPGRDPARAHEVILVTAHHDHLGDGYLGANDDASGVAALVAIAEELARTDAALARTVVVIAFGGEERGLLGSRHLVAHPPPALDLAHVVHQVNLDMVGSHGDGGLVAALGTFPGLAHTADLRARARAVRTLRVGFGGVARGGDHEPLCARGVPYTFFWTPDRRCYHRRCDRAARLDYPRMAAITQLAYAHLVALATTPADLAGQRGRRGCGLPPRARRSPLRSREHQR